MILKNKVVVVTGSSSGIGKAVAEAFAKEGAKVVINSKSNKEGGDAVANGINALGGDAFHIQSDLGNSDNVVEFFKRIVAKYNTVDILINNAGRTIPQSFEALDKQHWLDTIDDNLMPTILCSKEAARIMKLKKQGAIINTSSIRGIDHTGREGIMAYSAAKAAINNFTRTLAKELAPYITVNAVAPGFIHTPYLDKCSDEIKQNWLKLIPIDRFIEPEEIANSYIFLASSPYITGTILIADGGFTLKIG
ncbi:MAG: SDR family oxidoreductase [Flavobacteriaceae bacterium]|nr:SDR family oxidoreductase [Flavobacteriaceae bacterium]